MPGSLSPTPEPSEDEGSRGSKELSPTQRSPSPSDPPSPTNLPPTRAEIEGYTHLVGSLALRDATSLGPALLGAPLWSPTPHPSERGSSPDRLLSVSRRSSGPSGIIPTPRTANKNERRIALRRERAAFRASMPEVLGGPSSEVRQEEDRRRTLWPEYPAGVLSEQSLGEAVQDTAADMAVRERMRHERSRFRGPTVDKPRNKKGRFLPAAEGEEEDVEMEQDELDSDPSDDDDEIDPEVAHHIAAEVQTQVDRTLAAIAAFRPPSTGRARENLDPLDWKAVLGAAALTVDPAIIERATVRLEKLFHSSADDLHAHRMKILADARAAPKQLLKRRDDVFARTRVTETRVIRTMEKTQKQREREAKRAEEAAAKAAKTAAIQERLKSTKKKRTAATRAAEKKKAEREAREAAAAAAV